MELPGNREFREAQTGFQLIHTEAVHEHNEHQISSNGLEFFGNSNTYLTQMCFSQH